MPVPVAPFPLLPVLVTWSLACDDGQEESDPGPFRGLRAELHPDQPALVVVHWAQEEPTDRSWVEYRVGEEDWQQTPERPGTTEEHRQVVVGVPYDHEITWRVVGVAGEETLTSPTGSFQTASLPARLPQVEAVEGDPSAWQVGADFLFTSVSEDGPFAQSVNFWLVILDRKGRYVWSQPIDTSLWTLFPRPSMDGTALLWDAPTFWALGMADEGRVYRQRLDGTIERSWSTPTLHHSFAELDEDSILWNGVGERTDIIYQSDGDEPAVALWDCAVWMVEEGIDDPDDTRSCAGNALSWHAETDQLIYSVFSHEMVIALDRASGEVDWYADPLRGFGLQVEVPWAHQHDAQLLDGETLLLFSGLREDPTDTEGELLGSLAYQYHLDLANNRLELEWSAPADDWVAELKGGATRLPDGNTLVNYGDLGGVREFTPEGAIVWELSFLSPPTSERSQHWVGKTSFIDDLYAMAEAPVVGTSTP